MIIDRDTTIKALLDQNQDGVITALVRLNKNFAKLKNPLLRKLFAKRVSIADACRIANCNLADFFKSMDDLGFQLKSEDIDLKNKAHVDFKIPAEHLVVEFDVRPILEENKDPLKAILEKLKKIKQGEYLKVINTFEPIPLINLLRKKGISSYTETVEADLVMTYFFRPEKEIDITTPVLPSFASFEDVLTRYEGKLKKIDVSLLEMPLPMHTILETLADLPPGEALLVQHRKVPAYLLPHLHDQEFEYLIREEEPGKVSMLIFAR